MTSGRPVLVLVTGTGRSGTSTMAGALHHAGLHVPGPHLGADDTNPKGFFESRWSVDWHRTITRAAHINDVDGRPDAAARAARAVTPEHRAQLRAFLAEATDGAARTVVKDPRTVWVQAVWREEADAAGLDLRWITMLRHPAEVVGSRASHYAAGRGAGDADPRAYATTNLARWVNGALTSEHGTRGDRRAFVDYAALLADWRAALGALAAPDPGLGLVFDPDLAQRPHPNDEFVEPGLRRHEPSWDGLDVPDDLRGLAQEVWEAFTSDSPDTGLGPDTHRLDELRDAYARSYADAAAVARDAVTDGAPDGRRRRPGGRRPAPAATAPTAPPAAERRRGLLGRLRGE